MAVEKEMITGAEFGRWREDFRAFQIALDKRLGDGFDGLNHRLDDLNGRTRKNSEAIAATAIRLDVIEREEDTIEQTVRAIRDDGCSQYAAHVSVMSNLAEGPSDWSARKKAAVSGGLLAGGAGIWLVLQEVARVVGAYINHGR